MARPTPEERFWPRIVAGLNGCWIWTGNCLPNRDGSPGYGRFSVNGKDTLVHRWSYEHHVGPIPDETPFLDHTCEVERCVRPDHLEPVTNGENIRRINARRKACKRGHPLIVDEDFYVTPSNGKKSCARCKDDNNHAREYRGHDYVRKL